MKDEIQGKQVALEKLASRYEKLSGDAGVLDPLRELLHSLQEQATSLQHDREGSLNTCRQYHNQLGEVTHYYNQKTID